MMTARSKSRNGVGAIVTTRKYAGEDTVWIQKPLAKPGRFHYALSAVSSEWWARIRGTGTRRFKLASNISATAALLERSGFGILRFVHFVKYIYADLAIKSREAT
jgi:hypothetical protein